MNKRYDHRQGSYAACLETWRELRCLPGWKPQPNAFGSTEEEAAVVEQEGYPTDGLPEPLRPRKKEAP